MNIGKCSLCAATVAVLVSGMAWGQTPNPNPNGDIVKMIQAGLPEGTVVNKIREGAGHWDTSVDGLIVLKQAGATASELDALTAAVPPPAPVPVAPAAPTVVQVLGGYLTNHGGDYTLFEPGSSPYAYELSNMLFHIVVVDGHPALRLSVRGDYLRKMYGHCYSTWGDLIIEHDKVTYYPYGRINWAFALGKWKSETMAPDPSLKPYSMPLASVKPKEWDQQHEALPGELHLTERGKFSDDDFPYSFAWGSAFEKGRTMPSQEFLTDLFSNFDGTMAQLLQAASLSDPDKQLAPEFHFRQPNEAEIPALLGPLNRDVARWRTALLAERKEKQAEQAARSGGGNGFLDLMNVMQGVTNMAQAQSAANAAAASHNMAGQVQAAMDAGRAEAQTLNAISNPNAPAIQPLAPPDPNAIQNQLNQQLGNIQAKQAQAQAAQAQAAAAQAARQQQAAQQAAAQRAQQEAAQQAAQQAAAQQQAQSAASTAQQNSNASNISQSPDHNCIGGEKNYKPGKGCLIAAH